MNSRSTLLLAVLGYAVSGCLTSVPQSKATNTSAVPSAPASVEPFVWPRGTRAAVSLTYDDAIQSQLEHAVPALARHDFLATFFLTGSSPVLQASPERYRALQKAGHELASHTMNHPCDRALSFVQPGLALQDYDRARMDAELAQSLQLLRDLGQTEPFSFAYPCGSSWLGEPRTSYVPAVAQRFVAARGVAGRVTDPKRDSLFEVPSVMGNAGAEALTAWVDRALSTGGWVVFTFHGVAGDYLAVTGDAHEALLSYLEQHKTSVWTERFGTIARYVRAQRPR